MKILQKEAQNLIRRKRDLNSHYVAHSKNYLLPAINSSHRFTKLI